MRRIGTFIGALVVLAVLAVLFSAVPAGAAAAPGAAARASPSASPTIAAASAGPNGAVASRVLSSLQSQGIPSRDAYLPNFNAGLSTRNGVVSPLYTGSPAPMGVGDFGMRAGAHGGLTPFTQTTASVEGTFTLNNVSAFYLDNDGTDQYGWQLNTVLTHVTVFGNSSDVYWTQNVIDYTQHTGTLEFIDNVWNFSSPAFNMPTSTILHGAGIVVAPVFYYDVGPTIAVKLPVTVHLYTNAALDGTNAAMYFNYSLTDATGHTWTGSYDHVVFNSRSKSTPMPIYLVTGSHVTPTGYLLYDAELMVGGPGGGSTTSFYSYDGTMQLLLWDATSHSYQSAPAVFDYGTDTGETSEGVGEWYSTAGTPTVHLAAGPSILYPLWGAGGTPGFSYIHGSVSPSNAFVFANPGGHFTDSANWAPVAPSGAFAYWLMPGTYSFEFLLADHSPAWRTATADATYSVTLSLDLALGVYTPLMAWGNAQLAAISQSGKGTSSSPYVLDNNQHGSLSPLFGEFNDFFFPVFPGVALVGTSAYVAIDHGASLEITYSSAVAKALARLHLPGTNHLQTWLYASWHVAIVNTAGITGWLSSYQDGFPEAPLMLWNASDNLVAADTFVNEGSSIFEYNGYGNTYWGNAFMAGKDVASSALYQAFAPGLAGAIQLDGSGNLVFNNYFGAGIPVPAWTATSDVYNGVPRSYHDRWNVPETRYGTPFVVNGWLLRGAIVGGKVGGNYWANYGTKGNPYGVLPYNDYGLITNGGDYHPLPIGYRAHPSPRSLTAIPD